MTAKLFTFAILIISLTGVIRSQDGSADKRPLTPINLLERTARVRTTANARVQLADVQDIKNADVLRSGNVPNYIRAMRQHTKAASQYADLVQTVLFGGTVSPETKMAMGLRIAQTYNSPYLYAQANRWMRASRSGREMLADWVNRAAQPAAEKLAVDYAERLTKDIHGVTDTDFAAVRSVYNDAQIVELTMTVCFFNHFVRLAEGLNLPVETWVLDDKSPKMPEIEAFANPKARIALVSDKEPDAGTSALAAVKQAEAQAPQNGLGIGIANSQRAMMRVPDFQAAWRNFGSQNRQSWSIDRNIQLQISFAVSMANGCRYCTLHQVLGLRRLGVDTKKLLSMKKDDSALTPRELAAVVFARKLTVDPASISDNDFAGVKKEFGEGGAVEVILQTGNFAFMNRFTDGLRLPSEDEAVKTYQEVYGDNTYKTDWKKPK
ncbi:MAG: hypothetical protein HOP17_17145 [Acidobacteria bacterium]|nr:hypothetical protein [Acidobacteriota bacterium]